MLVIKKTEGLAGSSFKMGFFFLRDAKTKIA